MKIKRLTALAALLALALTLLLSLGSCAGGSGGMPTKDELRASIGSDCPEYTKVYGYLRDWGFKGFNSSKLDALEGLYARQFYKALPSARVMAEAIANNFLDYFYDDIDLSSSTAVTDALIHCYVAETGDAYGVYRTADEYVDYNTDMSGAFVGIGISVQYVNDEILIISVYDDSPAARADIREGDIIVKVNGESVDELGYERAIDNVRGEAGTDVTVTVLRDGEEIDCVATRAPITEISVSYELSEDLIGYIEITSFKSNTDEQFIEAINYMEQNGARALIFDLRSNGGGYLDTVINMIDYLVPKGTAIVSFGSYAQTEYAKSEHAISMPVAVLTNQYTASASELFVAALRDYSSEQMQLLDCIAVGTTTFGKGVMQNTFSFTDRSAITLTVAYFNSPLGNNHNGVGLAPDFEVLPSETEDNQLARAYSELLTKISN